MASPMNNSSNNLSGDRLLKTKTSASCYIGMKKHDTFPGEQPEMPVPKVQIEIKQPHDPQEPKVPGEDPQQVPDELPPGESQPEEPKLKQG